MIVRELLNEIAMELTLANKPMPPGVDRPQLFRLIEAELNQLTAEAPWEWANRYLSPAIGTIAGTRNYVLPADFGLNFLAGANADGYDYVCLINDGSNESTLKYKTNAQFYSMNLQAEVNAKPSAYTIISRPDGRRLIALSPPPDANYTINGAYAPVEWHLSDMDALPPVPSNCAVLKYGILKRIDPMFEPMYGRELMKLFARSAGPIRLKVKLGEYAGVNEYAQQKGRY